MVLLLEDIWQCPVTKAMDVSQFSFSVKNLLRPFAGETQRFGELTEQLDDLSDVIVVFAVLGAGLRIEEIVTCDQFEDLCKLYQLIAVKILVRLTMQAMLQTSVLAPHFAPRMTSGDRY